MEEVLNVLRSILQNESDHLHIYIEAFEECQIFQQNNADVAQIITMLLSKNKSRLIGFRLLLKYLDQCKMQIIEERASLWMTHSLKACNNQELSSYADIIYEVLGKLAHKMQMTPDLNKTFINNFIGRVYDALLKSFDESNYAALRCMKLCLRVYAGPSGLHRTQIERFLTKFIDSTDQELVKESAKCRVLLQQVRGGGERGVNYKIQWKNYQLNLLGSLHALLDEAFSKCRSTFDGGVVSEQLNIQPLPDNDEPAQRTVRLVVRFCNLVAYLQYALSESFPVEKPIFPLKILNIINRGLEITLANLKEKPIIENLTLGVFIPKMHTKLLELLETLILVLGSHLRSYHPLILGSIFETLKWTSTKNTNGTTKPFINLRATAYRVLKLWCLTFSGGSLVETGFERLLKEVINDIKPFQPELTLKVHNVSGKYMSKKARRELQKANNERSSLSQNHSHYGSIDKQNCTDESNTILCQTALSCLQQVLLSAGHCIRPTLIKITQIKILEICALFYELPLKKEHLYFNGTCRLEIYKCLYALIMFPHPLCPPPFDMALSILQNAQMADWDSSVRFHCLLMMGNLEKCVHPQKESLLFPIEAKDIEQAFAKHWQGKQLEESSFLASQNIGPIEDETSLIDKDVESNHDIGEDEIDCMSELSCDDGNQSISSEPKNKKIRLENDGHNSPRYISELVKKTEHLFDSLTSNEISATNIDNSSESRKHIGEVKTAELLIPKNKKIRLENGHNSPRYISELVKKTEHLFDVLTSNEISATNIDDSSESRKQIGEDKTTELLIPKEDNVLLLQNDDKLFSDLEAAFVDEFN